MVTLVIIILLLQRYHPLHPTNSTIRDTGGATLTHFSHSINNNNNDGCVDSRANTIHYGSYGCGADPVGEPYS